ncbi:hypothetical protein BSPLISOX_735 [uncultured Gammaproteobacteria bacterium]|jgi:hypothetical protein|nr:hypothetical protein [uncultured Gammaproteobacteria bacterium]VVH65987.1 hypothetical protein BSPLISOX_735 [uncultured Gammaproteobacteria bacterium]
MKTKLVVETILCLKNNKKVFLNGYDINTHTYPDDCPKNTIYDKKIIAYEKRYLNETSAPPVSSNIICYDNKDNIIWILKPDLSQSFGCWDYKEGFALYCYDGKLEIDNWKGARYSVDFNTGQASFMFSGKN